MGIDVNVTARPAAGVTGVMALPIHGAWKSLRRRMAGTPQNTLREPRTALSRQAASHVSKEEKEHILKTFEEAQKGATERRKKLKAEAEVFLGMRKQGKDGKPEAGPEGKVTDEKADEGLVAPPGTEPPVERDVESEGEGEEMTEAERRGYERAMRELRLEKERDVKATG